MNIYLNEFKKTRWLTKFCNNLMKKIAIKDYNEKLIEKKKVSTFQVKL